MTTPFANHLPPVDQFDPDGRLVRPGRGASVPAINPHEPGDALANFRDRRAFGEGGAVLASAEGVGNAGTIGGAVQIQPLDVTAQLTAYRSGPPGSEPRDGSVEGEAPRQAVGT